MFNKNNQKFYGVFLISLLSASCGNQIQNKNSDPSTQPTPVNTESLCNSETCLQSQDLMDGILRNKKIDTIFDSEDDLSCADALKNHQLQQYQKNDYQITDRISLNASLSQGKATCYQKPQGSPANMNFISEKMDTKNNFTFNKDEQGAPILKGGVEVTAAVPFSEGLWPAIWMLPHTPNWPTGMEFDIAEYQHLTSGTSVKLGSHVHYGLNSNDKKTNVDPNDPNPGKTTWNYNGNGIDKLNMPIIDESNPIQPAIKHVYGFTWKCDGHDLNDIGNCDLGWYLDGKQYLWMHFDKSDSVETSSAPYKSYISDDGVTPHQFSIQKKGAEDWSEAPKNPAYTAYKSLKTGLNAGYYLILNIAVGGDGAADHSYNNEAKVQSFKNAKMDIFSIKRYILK